MTRSARLPALLTGLALMGAVSGCAPFGNDTKTATARFDRTVGLYEQSDVRILGVRVGQVTSIEPDGDGVRVEMEYDAKYDIPADAQALVVAPSIVSDRYVQLSPAYTGGAVLADGARIERENTQVPLELDEVYAALDDLNVALGPQGANKDGALSDLLAVSADNLEGNGELLGTTLEDFSQFVSTLSDQRDDLFGTVNNLQQFTTTIANSDDVVRAFNRDLAVVSDQLAGEREDLARSVRQLSIALGDVATFVAENRESLTTNVEGLADATRVLVDHKVELEEFIDNSAVALSNLQLAYNPEFGTLETRDNNIASFEQTPLLVLCPLLVEGPKRLTEIAPLVPDDLRGPLAELGGRCRDFAESVPPQESGPSALPVPGAAAATAVPVPRDLTLSGLLMGTR